MTLTPTASRPAWTKTARSSDQASSPPGSRRSVHRSRSGSRPIKARREAIDSNLPPVLILSGSTRRRNIWRTAGTKGRRLSGRRGRSETARGRTGRRPGPPRVRWPRAPGRSNLRNPLGRPGCRYGSTGLEPEGRSVVAQQVHIQPGDGLVAVVVVQHLHQSSQPVGLQGVARDIADIPHGPRRPPQGELIPAGNGGVIPLGDGQHLSEAAILAALPSLHLGALSLVSADFRRKDHESFGSFQRPAM